MKAVLLTGLKELAAVLCALAVWWTIAVCSSLVVWFLLGMPPATPPEPPDTTDYVFYYEFGFALETWELPGFFLGFILALYAYRFVITSGKRDGPKAVETERE